MSSLSVQQLRENAMQHLRDARLLLPSSPKSAAYMAGYALEFMLKARYCGRRGWPNFPETARELKQWLRRDGIEASDDLFTHDLDDLLVLSDSVAIRRASYHSIDWKSATSWTEQIRYQPPDSFDRDSAERLIVEVEKVVDELRIFEILSRVRQVEIDLAAQYGPFHFFGYVQDTSKKRWGLLVSWSAPNEAEWREKVALLRPTIEAALDRDLFEHLSFIQALAHQHPTIQGALVIHGVVMGPIQHAIRAIHSSNIVVGVGLANPPDGYYITAANWPLHQLQEEWVKCAERRKSKQE